MSTEQTKTPCGTDTEELRLEASERINACNAHDDLLAAAKQVADDAEYCIKLLDGGWSCCDERAEKIMARATRLRAAIAKADPEYKRHHP